jgi:caffeoyl-CoA O-methyltransferase
MKPHSDILNYAYAHSHSESDLLSRLRRETHLRVLYPQMMSRPLQGRFLASVSKLVQPHHILEIGTFTGYGTLCLAEGLAQGGRITTLDINAELDYLRRAFWQQSAWKDQIEARYGPALDLLDEFKGPFDLVFIDADKQNYLSYYQAIFPKVRPGGIILADNVLWHNKVVDPAAQDKETTGIRAFNDFVSQDKRVDCVLLPLMDGMMWIQKR